MTIQENNRLMQAQLLTQAKKCRTKYEILCRNRDVMFKSELKTELLTRAMIFERVAHNLLLV